MSDHPITLDFLARQQQKLLEEMVAMRNDVASVRGDIALIKDDITVLAAMAQRQDRATKTLLERIETLTAQQGRFNERLRRLEDHEA